MAMASKKEIADCFQELNITASEVVLNKCLEMCVNYNIGAEDFCDQWYAYTASNLSGAVPTIEHLEKMERKEFQNNKDQGFSRKSLSKVSTPIHNSIKISDNFEDPLVSSYLESTPKSNRNRNTVQTPVQITHTPKTPVAKKLLDSYAISPSISTSEKYSQRSDSRSVQCYHGSHSAKYKRDSDIILTVRNQNEHSLTSDVKYMYEVMGKKARCLDNITYNLGHAILETHGLTLSEGLLKTQLGEMTTYGRIVSDSDGKINVQSVLLEGTQETNLSNTTTLNINKLSKYSLFPGQVVAVQGNNVNSGTFIAEKIFTEATLSLPEEPPLTSDQMQIVVAAGPFTLQDNLSYQPLHDLLSYVSEYRPHILILMGPFLERTHDSIHDGGLAQTFDSFFEGLMENIMSSVQNSDTHVIVVSSQKDVHHHPVYPTPPFKIAEQYNNLTFVPDPCMVNVNGLVIGATSADILMHISNFELYLDKNPAGPIDRMGRMASHILNQRSFYPLYPPLKGVCIDHELLEQFGTLECKPHILILPSNLKYFIKNIQDCLVINPERLTKGYVAGTYARIEISPGNTSICDRTACQILRVYRNRNERYCKSTDEFDPFYRRNIWENPWYLFLFIILGIIFIMMFLGIIKGLIGLYCSRKMAEIGLGMLVDLPKPLDRYQEHEYRHLPVQYDIGGWPVNPYTYERTVRVLPNKTVFCLNLIFFLAYPLALILQLCSLCCCIRNYEEQSEKGCFKSVNVIKFNENLKKKDAYKTAGQKLDMYKDDDKKEEEDTNYVINMMKQSQLSLQKGM